MNLQPVKIPRTAQQFYTTCIRCNQLLFGSSAKADRDGCPLRSFYCPACAERVTADEAAGLAAVARKLIHTNA